MKGHLLRISLLLGCILILFSSSNLFSDQMFSFHDVTQPARVLEFSNALRDGQLPPRISHSFSFGMGYPLFNFYAPTAYWITSTFHLLGLSVAAAIKLSFFLSVCVLGVGSYLLFTTYFSATAAILGALLLVSSHYIATEIFVRGNIAEMWFLALFPLTLYTIRSLSRGLRPSVFVFLTVILSALLTAHNVLSLIGFGLIILFSFTLPRKKIIFTALFCSFVLSAYFLVPAFGEMNWTHAKQVASNTIYNENFVCPKQLWSSPWAFGGSVVGCTDGMSFMLGKVLLSLGILGIVSYLYSLMKHWQSKTRNVADPLYIYALMAIGGIFLSLEYSLSIWKMFEPILKLFQFPWRFLVFGIFGLSFFAAYVTNFIRPKVVQILLVVVFAILAIGMSRPYFISNPQKTWSQEEFDERYLSPIYIKNQVVYRIPEYIPSSVDYQWWVDLQAMKPPVFSSVIAPQDNGTVEEVVQEVGSYEVTTSSKSFFINKHYLPYWNIYIDNTKYIPTFFDQYGRPNVRITSNKPVSRLKIYYSQTPLEKFSNILTIMGIVLLLCLIQPKIWKRLVR